MKKLRYLSLMGLALLLSGCKMAVLDPKGLIAANEKHLLIMATLLMLIVVIPVIVLSFVFAFRYRANNKKATYKPNWSHNTLMEIIWWTIPCVIIGILAVVTWISTHKLDPYRPLDVKGKPLVIQAISLNWKWLFIYPKQHIATVNYIKIPVDTPVRFLITSDAPMNSLEIPQLAGQVYAMTGMQTKLNLIGNALGNYHGLSTSFSGEGFSDMSFVVNVATKKQFHRWVHHLQKEPTHLSIKNYRRLEKPSHHYPRVYYSQPANHLFGKVMSQYNAPHMGLLEKGPVRHFAKKRSRPQNKGAA